MLTQDIEKFAEKLDLKIKLMLFLYISFNCVFIINLMVRKHGKLF